jgi:hypothetical protein
MHPYARPSMIIRQSNTTFGRAGFAMARGERRWGWLQAGPPDVDDHVVADARADGVMQAETDDTVIVRVERPGGIFA